MRMVDSRLRGQVRASADGQTPAEHAPAREAEEGGMGPTGAALGDEDPEADGSSRQQPSERKQPG